MAAQQPQSDLARKVSGEVLEPGSVQSLAIGVARAEVDQQVEHAQKRPRDIEKIMNAVMSLATLDEETAAEMIYARPQGGEIIRGPSIRFAELMFQTWGHNRSAARTVDVTEKYVEAEGIYWDLYTNASVIRRVRRPITKKNGQRYDDQMINTTANAAGSIALRNAILSGIPKPIWRKVIQEVERLIAGDAKTLTARRSAAIEYLKDKKGIDPKRIYGVLKVGGLADITLDKLLDLRALTEALKDTPADEVFPPVQAGLAEKVATPEGQKEPAAPKSGRKAQPQGFDKAHVDREVGNGAKTKTGDGAETQGASTESGETPHDPETGEVHEAEHQEVGAQADAQGADDGFPGDRADFVPLPDHAGPFASFWRLIEGASAAAITAALPGVYMSDEFNEMDAPEQAEFRAAVWARAEGLPDVPAVTASPTYFRLWIDSLGTSEDADAILEALDALSDSEAFARMKPESQERVRAAAANRIDMLRRQA